MKQPPGLQLLHCLKSSVTGGLSTFVDGLNLASNVHTIQRDAFDALTSFPVSFHYNAPGKAFFDTKPVIEIDENAELMIEVCQSSLFIHSISRERRMGPWAESNEWPEVRNAR